MTLKSVWLENKHEHKLISAQCILTGKYGCRTFGSMAKRIVNCISARKKIFTVSLATGNIFLATGTEWWQNRWTFTSDKVTVQWDTNTLWSDKLLPSNYYRRFPCHVRQFHEWVGQCPLPTDILRPVDTGLLDTRFNWIVIYQIQDILDSSKS